MKDTMKRRLWWPLGCVLLGAALPARADRDIVYSARYYYPSGRHQTSRLHLYRIHPDGTGRRQLTRGDADDYAPFWSPDGRQILFQRSHGGGRHDLCVVKAGGGHIRTLFSLRPDIRYMDYGWSPNGRWIAYTQP